MCILSPEEHFKTWGLITQTVQRKGKNQNWLWVCGIESVGLGEPKLGSGWEAIEKVTEPKCDGIMKIIVTKNLKNNKHSAENVNI